jgi:hypothetical protein
MKSKFIPASYVSCAIVFALMVIFVPVSLRAQEVRGKISGGVLDPNKAAVPGASVKVTDVARGTTASLTTNDEGLFQANYLLSGTYQVVVEMAGFKKYIQDGVLLQISENRDLIIVLEVGGTQETVTVTAEAANLNTADANLGQTLDQKRVEELPLVHGDPYTLIGLSTGVTYTGSTRLDRPFEPTHIIGYAFDGTRGNRSDLLIDGAPSTATANANEVIATYVPPSDIVQEFKVQTATFDSQFGNTEGGVTSISIKSGTNRLHGTAYLWTEPGGMAANDFFGNSRRQGRPFSYSNRPGFSVSGPVVIPKVYKGKNKTFFLFAYEAIRDARPRHDIGASNPNTFVPTQALKDGNFSGFAGLTIYDPLTGVVGTGTGGGGNGCAVGDVCRTAFAGNIIQPNRINPVAQSLLKYFGPPKQSGLLGNINDSTLTEKTKPYDNFTVRVDQVIGSKDRMFARASWYDRFSIYNDYTATAYSGVNFIFRARQGVIDDVHTFNAATVLNVRYGYNYFLRHQDQEVDARGFDLTQLGFPASFNNLNGAEARRFPRFDFPASTILGNGMSNEFRPVVSHSASAVLNKALNAHSLKIGAELRVYREDTRFSSNDQTGQFIFDNAYTRQRQGSTAGEVNGLQAFASFLLGYPTTLNFVRRADFSEFSKTYGFFVQDDWRINNKLMLNLGLRYEVETPLVERNDKSVSGFDPTYVQPLQAAAQAKYATLNDPALKALLPQLTATGGLLFAGKDTGRGLYHTPRNTFLPRVGFAYQLDSRTVIRGGFGLFAGFLGERRGDVSQPGFTRTTVALLTTNVNGAPIPYTLSTPFANTPILDPVGNADGKQTNLGQANTFFNQNPKVSKQARWQIGVQRELAGGWVAEAEIVGNHGYNIEINRNINALPLKYLNADNSLTTGMTTNDAFLRGTVANPFQGLPGSGFNNATIARSQLLRPFPEFGDLTTTNNEGQSWYYSGQFSLQKRFSKGYTVQASYTLSRWTQATEYLNAADPSPTVMISDQDSPQRFALSAMYQLPFGKEGRFFSNPNWLVNAVFGGWQLGGTVQLQSGFPVPFATDAFYKGGQLDIPSDQRKTDKWFNTSAFTSILNDTATNSTPVNHLRTLPLRFANVRRDYIKNVDLTLKKDIQLRESMKIQFRFEALNAFNEPYFPNPVVNPTSVGTVIPGVCNNTLASPCPGSLGTMNPSNQDNYARRIQMGVKFIF